MEPPLLKSNINCKATTINLICYFCYCMRIGLPSLRMVWTVARVYFCVCVLSFLLDKISTVERGGSSPFSIGDICHAGFLFPPSPFQAQSQCGNYQGVKSLGRHTSVIHRNYLVPVTKVLATDTCTSNMLRFLCGQAYTKSKQLTKLFPSTLPCRRNGTNSHVNFFSILDCSYHISP